MELAKRVRYSATSPLYRSKTEKGLRFNVAEFVLLVHQLQNKLHGLSCKGIGKRIHVAGEIFVRTNDNGVEMLKFFLNKEKTICPGNPKVPLTQDQWEAFKLASVGMLEKITGSEVPVPCFTQRDHFDNEQEFIGCSVCLPFQK